MNDLVELDSYLPDQIRDLASNAKELIKARHSKATREAYATDWRDFSEWALGNKMTALPCEVGTVVLYMAACVEVGLKPNTIARKVAAINYAHKQANLPSPTTLEPVKAALAGIRRTKGMKVKQAAPATIEVMEKILDTCEDDLRGKRDKALLAIGFGGALRRSELAALQVEDIEFTDNGLLIDIQRSKTDQEQKGERIAILQGERLKVKTLLKRWLRASQIKKGYVFRGIVKDKIKDTPITHRQLTNIIKRKAMLAGLDPKKFSGHSLRAGFVTSAATAGANLFSIMDVSRHKSVDTVRKYVRRAEVFKDHAGSKFM